MKEYKLPKLPYGYEELEPYIDKETVTLHHDKHHQGYINGLNSTLKKIYDSRDKEDYSSIKALERDLAFHGSGAMLHTIYWESLCPEKDSIEPTLGAFLDQVKKDFGSIEAMKAQMTAAANSVEGSGWAVLAWEPIGEKLLILQSENHQKLTIWGVRLLFAIDVWEHAYYLKYQNRRAEYVENIWKIINWKEIEKKFNTIVY